MKIYIIHLNGLLIISKDFDQHLERLTRAQRNLKLFTDKCFFIKSKVKFLGYMVGEKEWRQI